MDFLKNGVSCPLRSRFDWDWYGPGKSVTLVGSWVLPYLTRVMRVIIIILSPFSPLGRFLVLVRSACDVIV